MIITLMRRGEGPWQAEILIEFGAFVLHATGWRLRGLFVGNVPVVWAGPVDLLLSGPVRIVHRGSVAMLITADLVGGEELPFVVLEPVETLTLHRRLSRQARIFFDEDV